MKITIDGEEFEILGEIEHITLADSFVFTKKKSTTGHGEARLYVGSQNEETKNFFGDFRAKCFFLKDDFQSYLNDSKIEYKKQEQGYREDISDRWEGYMEGTETLNEGKIYFSVDNATGKEDINRFYVRSKDGIYKFMREIALPTISYLTILKLQSNDGQHYFYFRLFLDYYYTVASHPTVIKEEEEKIESEKIPLTEKMQLMKARIGQGDFREKLLMETAICPVTQIADERILVASHIKPWAISSPKEKLDPKNGLVFTPTYDKLFNDGFISFEDDGTMLISPWLSPLTVKKLGIAPNRKYQIPIKGRENYMKYHREKIFKK